VHFNVSNFTSVEVRKRSIPMNTEKPSIFDAYGLRTSYKITKMFREIENPTAINSGVFRWGIFRFSYIWAEGERSWLSVRISPHYHRVKVVEPIQWLLVLSLNQ